MMGTKDAYMTKSYHSTKFPIAPAVNALLRSRPSDQVSGRRLAETTKSLHPRLRESLKIGLLIGTILVIPFAL
jgi:hypothetical protein